MAKWQFQDFCKENSRNNEEFRHAVEKMIMVEEKTKERFPYRNNRENNRDNSDRRKFSNIRHPDRKRGPDNTVTMADKTKKIQNSGDLKTLRICIVYSTRKEITQQEIAEFSLISMQKRKKTRIKKKITRRKTKTNQKTKVSNSRREQLQ
jgi:lipopolysaccharide biosynthesis protein